MEDRFLRIGDTLAIEDEQDGKLLAVGKVTQLGESWRDWVHVEVDGSTYKFACMEFCLLDEGPATDWSALVMNEGSEGCKDSWPNAPEYYS